MRSAISARPPERCLTGRPPRSVTLAARARSVAGSQTERLCGLEWITTAIKSSRQTACADKGTRISGAPFFQILSISSPASRQGAHARIRLVLITNHIATHVPALVGDRATRSRACSGSLCIGDPGDCHERSASNRSKKDFLHGVPSVDREECRPNPNSHTRTAFRQLLYLPKNNPRRLQAPAA
jgi:hypothetical protein